MVAPLTLPYGYAVFMEYAILMMVQLTIFVLMLQHLV